MLFIIKKIIVLTEGQQNFVDYVEIAFKEKMILLQAPAGRRKTFVAKYIISKIGDANVKILAPTHKAKQVLSKTISRVETIHSFSRAKREFKENGEVYFQFNCDFKVTNKVIFVDECSMITDEMFNEFKELALNNLMIFAGDKLQLPPINTKELDEEEVKKKSKLSKVFSLPSDYTLTKNMKSKNTFSNLIVEKAREAIMKRTMPSKIAEISLKQTVSAYTNTKNLSIITLAYSRKRVNLYNQEIRKGLLNIHNTEDLEDYYIGENLVFNGFRLTPAHRYYTSDIIKI
jgi:hypothetical protein